MKKWICAIVAVLYLCSMLAVAGAESPTLDSVTGSWVTAENVADAAALGLFVEPLNEFSSRFDMEQYELLRAIGDSQLALLQKSEKVTDYFGIVTVASTGAKVPLLDLFNGAEPLIYEFSPVIAGGYQLAYGRVTATLLFATPYEPGQEVAVLIGVVEDEDYTLEDDLENVHVEWYAYRGLCVSLPEVDGAEGIQVTFEPEMVIMLQDADTLIAIASQAFDFE